MRKLLYVLAILLLTSGCTMSADFLSREPQTPTDNEDLPSEDGPYQYGAIPGGMLKTNLSFGPGRVSGMIRKSDGSLFLAGTSGTFNDIAPVVVKMNDDGSFDSSFGSEGRASGTVGMKNPEFGIGLAVDSESRTYVVGENNDDKSVIYRFLANGSLDSSFGDEGVFVSNEDSRFYSVAVLPDDSIVVVGSIYYPGETSGLYVLKLLEDGTFDSTFSGDGVLMTAPADQVGGRHVIVDTLAGIPYLVVASYFDPAGAGETSVQLSRWKLDGTLDNSFGTNGEFVIPTAVMFEATKLIRRSSGSYALVGSVFDDGMQSMMVQVTSAGALDTSFGGGDGKFGWDFGGDDTLLDLTELSNGKLAVVGVHSMQEQIHVVLLDASGALDTSFDGDGYYKTTLPDRKWQPRAIVELADGQLLIAGYHRVVATGDYGSFLFKLNLSTGPVNSFGTNGFMDLAVANGEDSFNRSLITKDGKFLMLGSKNEGSVLYRLNKDYTVDTSFADDGYLELISIAYFFAYDVVELSDGSYLVSGEDQDNGKGVVLAFNSDGSVKTSFATNGVFVDTSIGTSFSRILELHDGKIAAVGRARGEVKELYAVRLNANGSLDTDFGTAGAFAHDLDEEGGLNTVFETADGSLIAGGNSVNADWDYSDLVIKLTPQGTLDADFAVGGVFRRENWAGNGGYVAKVLQAPDGKIIAASGGSADGAGIAVFRLLENGQLDASFGTGGYVSTEEGWGWGMTTDISLLDLGEGHYRINALGYADLDMNTLGLAIVRFDETGVRDSSFDADGIYHHELTEYGGAYSEPNFMHTSDGSIFVSGSLFAPRDLFVIKVQ